MYSRLLKASFLLIGLCASITTALAGGAIVALDESESIEEKRAGLERYGYDDRSRVSG